MTLGERVRKIRRQMDLTQQDFGKRIGIKSNSVSLIESGGRNASDQVVLAICREFDISEDWLRTGAGEMFEPEATNALDALVKERGISRGEQILIEKFLNLKPESRQAVMNYLLDVAAAISGTVEATHTAPVEYVPKFQLMNITRPWILILMLRLLSTVPNWSARKKQWQIRQLYMAPNTRDNVKRKCPGL